LATLSRLCRSGAMFTRRAHIEEAAIATAEYIVSDGDVGVAFPEDLNRMLSTVLGLAARLAARPVNG
jgi:hypothetical protein